MTGGSGWVFILPLSHTCWKHISEERCAGRDRTMLLSSGEKRRGSKYLRETGTYIKLLTPLLTRLVCMLLLMMFYWQRTDVSNTCHLTCVLQLELSVHEHYRDLTNSISSLQQLCCLHPYHPWYWLNLAMSFQRLLESPGCPERSSTEEEHEKQQGTNNIIRLKTIMCLIRARYVSHNRTSCFYLTLMLTDEFSARFVHLIYLGFFIQVVNWNPTDSAVLICAGKQPEGPTRHWGSSTCSAANRKNASDSLRGQTIRASLREICPWHKKNKTNYNPRHRLLTQIHLYWCLSIDYCLCKQYLKEYFTQNWQFCNYLLTLMLSQTQKTCNVVPEHLENHTGLKQQEGGKIMT